ncbi:MAG: hypothetical protein QOG62_2376 [Thermoleophilaceae bacterium]|nr:hypothetical protein [Thermoleophilaceae bacterium]
MTSTTSDSRPANELGIPWDTLADGDVHGLKRGVDFDCDTRFVVLAARNAASRRGQVVRCVRDDLLRHGAYVWLQFFDYEVERGQPCPRCGSAELIGARTGFPFCAHCGASLVVVALDEAPPWLVDPEDPAAPEPEPDAAVVRYAGPQRRQDLWDPATASRRRLECYEEVHINAALGVGAARLFGCARFGPKKWVLFMMHFLPHPHDDHLARHTITPIPASAFFPAFDLARVSDWPLVQIGPPRPEDGEIVAVSQYLSYCSATGAYLVPVADSALPEVSSRATTAG